MTDPASPQPDALPSEPLLAGVPIQRFIETLASPPLESAGTRIGPYKLLTVIGEGGFGVVWAAERSEPIVQRVALKIIKPGMDSRQVIARFEQERQALALMSHPSIAKVFDAGATPSGRPYFVMELVQGEPITAYCDRFKLSVRHRLEVFVSVCDAVQHAHYRGIIHRDLKPSNILVGPGDGEPRDSPRAIVKVIDFGVAKAVTRALTDKTIYTESGSMIGTPEYMSPEQVEIRGEDVDTRADVYSLGVILYELLVGALPLDSDVLRGAGFAEMARMIRETEAIRPSTRLGQLGGDTEASVAANRRIASRSLSQQLRRELDLIPLKALRKDRAERYASPNDLARDIRAYLAGRPLDARQPSIAYFTRKFFSRHKRPIVGIGALACVAIVGLWATLWQADRAAIQARRAQEALAEQNRLNDEQAAARAAASAWISIASEVAGSRAFWQRVDPATLRCSAPVEFAALPLTHHMLDPAQYRITVVAPGGEFAEFNAVLLEPGQDRETRFLVHGGAESPAALPAGGAARGLHARLIPLARVTAAMAYVPAGPNVYGWSPDAGTLNRRQTITLDAFWIDPTEVSRAEYRAFLDATG
ncbi:MAG: protein kinase domain-containing protein, partial [Phycisphaerales bacterium]